MAHKIYLASASPRRKQLLATLDVDFKQFSVDADETPLESESATELVTRLACLKAQTGVNLGYTDRPVLGSDTIVVLDGKALGKPLDKQDGIAMLSALSGRTHQVMTAIAIADSSNMACELVTTEVTFKQLSKQEIENYWASGEPQDKAGSYGIQGLAGQFVTNINGSYFSVVGLPLYETKQLIDKYFRK